MQHVIPLVRISARGREMFWKEACFDLCIPLHVTSVILREDFFLYEKFISQWGYFLAVHRQGGSLSLVMLVYLTK